VLFPFVTPLLVRLSRDIDGETLLAAYHTAYNVVGVAVLLPVINKFTRFVERILPERSSPLMVCLDPSALATPIVAVEAVRRTVARALAAVCGSVEAALGAGSGGEATRPPKDGASVTEAADALSRAQAFISDDSGPPDSEDEQRRLTRTLHALDHASRLAETAGNAAAFLIVKSGQDDLRAVELCAEAMRDATTIAREVAKRPADNGRAAPIESRQSIIGAMFDSHTTSTKQQLPHLEQSVTALKELEDTHRNATLTAVATGALTADEAMARVDAVRNLATLAFHAWRSAANLVGRDK
jgi:phosphate:Na+ symporter